MIKSYKVMLHPNNKQQTKMFAYVDAARFAYNWTLEQEENNYKNGNSFILDGELRKRFTLLKQQPEYSWLNDISNNVTKQAIKDAVTAYKWFFEGKVKHPRFKSRKHSKKSFYVDTAKIRITNTHVKLEKISNSKRKNRQKLNYVKLAEKNRIPVDAKYVNPRVTFDGLNWWLSVGIEYEDMPAVQNNSEGIGIDLGVKDLAICSDNVTYSNINKTDDKIKKLERRKRRLQRSVSRSYEKNKKGESYRKTSNVIKKEKLVLITSRKITNKRRNYIHQTTTDIIKREPSFISVEDLSIKGMMSNKHLSKAIQEQNLYEVRRQLEYKCLWNNIPFIVIDRWFPSSKLCNCCGNIKKDLKLSDRIYKCDCGYVSDRDYNAALNIRDEGHRLLLQNS